MPCTQQQRMHHTQQPCLQRITDAQDAARNGAQLVVLPEMWNCPYSNDSFPVYAEDLEAGPSPSTSMLSAAAREARVTLVGGSVPEVSAGKLYNTCCVYGPDGQLLAKHRCRLAGWSVRQLSRACVLPRRTTHFAARTCKCWRPLPTRTHRTANCTYRVSARMTLLPMHTRASRCGASKTAPVWH